MESTPDTPPVAHTPPPGEKGWDVRACSLGHGSHRESTRLSRLPRSHSAGLKGVMGVTRTLSGLGGNSILVGTACGSQIHNIGVFIFHWTWSKLIWGYCLGRVLLKKMLIYLFVDCCPASAQGNISVPICLSETVCTIFVFLQWKFCIPKHTWPPEFGEVIVDLYLIL